MSTHDKMAYAVMIGRKVIFMIRPAPTQKKSYREPIIAAVKWFKTKRDAEMAAKHWEGSLI